MRMRSDNSSLQCSRNIPLNVILSSDTTVKLTLLEVWKWKVTLLMQGALPLVTWNKSGISGVNERGIYLFLCWSPYKKISLKCTSTSSTKEWFYITEFAKQYDDSYECTEQVGLISRASHFHFADSLLKSQPRHKLCWLRFCVVFLTHRRQIPRQILKLDWDFFLFSSPCVIV